MYETNTKKEKRKWLARIGLLIFALLLFCAFDVRLKTVFYTVESDQIEQPVRLALVTDLHSCEYGSHQENLMTAIQKQAPDVVLLGGDIYDDKMDNGNTEMFLKAVSAQYPCYYVTGNHEYWSGQIEQILQRFAFYGIPVLQNRAEVLSVNGQTICLSGIDDPDSQPHVPIEQVLAQQFETLGETKTTEDYFSILLAHRPSYIATYLKEGFDLVLSGHAHGGQWRVPGIWNGLCAPDEGWFPQYAGGRYSFDLGEMIVSRGLARESTRVPRIFNRPELVIVDLQ